MLSGLNCSCKDKEKWEFQARSCVNTSTLRRGVVRGTPPRREPWPRRVSLSTARAAGVKTCKPSGKRNSWQPLGLATYQITAALQIWDSTKTNRILLGIILWVVTPRAAQRTQQHAALRWKNYVPV